MPQRAGVKAVGGGALGGVGPHCTPCSLCLSAPPVGLPAAQWIQPLNKLNWRCTLRVQSMAGVQVGLQLSEETGHFHHRTAKCTGHTHLCG